MIDQDALSPEKRNQILLGAAVVFARDGFEGASMSMIARQAQVSKGTLYNHFVNKADLFAAYMRQACTRYMGQIFDNLDDATDAATSLHAIAERIVAMLLTPERRAIYRMVVSEAESFPELAETFYAQGPERATRTLSAWIAQQTERGQLAVPDPAFAAEQFFALCQTRLSMAYRLYLLAQPTAGEVAQVADGAVAMFLSLYGIRQAPHGS